MTYLAFIFQQNQLLQLEKVSFTREDLNNGLVEGISSVFDERTADKTRMYTVVEFSLEVLLYCFLCCFLYPNLYMLCSI